MGIILALRGAICLGFASYQHDYLDDQVTRLHKYIYFLKRKEKERVGLMLL
jgi:hypothetical protein